MEINYAEFIGSFTGINQCPKDKKPEFAFIGRSNVGKSSLLNMLAGRKDLARVSKSPGKTQHLNFYLMDDVWYLVDLPGFGYAKISKTKRRDWEKMIDRYLGQRESLCCAFILIDITVPPQQNDLDFINRLGDMQVPFAIIFTKADKIKPGKRASNRQIFENELLKSWSEMPSNFVSSSTNREGRAEILEFIDSVNQKYLKFLGK